MVDDFRDFQLLSLKKERPKGRGKVTVAKYKEETTFIDFVPHSHTCVLGKFIKDHQNIEKWNKFTLLS